MAGIKRDDRQLGFGFEEPGALHSSEGQASGGAATGEGAYSSRPAQRQLLIECILRDEHTLRDPRYAIIIDCPGLGREFFERRIAGYKEELRKLDEETS